MKKMRMLLAAGMLGIMLAGTAMAADMGKVGDGQGIGGAYVGGDTTVGEEQKNFAQPIAGYVEILEVGEDWLLVKPEDGSYDQIRLNVSDETLLLNNKTAKALKLGDFAKGNRVYAYYSQAMTRSLPPQSHLLALLELEENEIPARYWVAEYVEGEVSGDLVATVDNGGLFLTLPQDRWVQVGGAKTEAAKLEAGDSFLAWYGVVALSYPGQARTERALVVNQTPAEQPNGNEQQKQPAEVQNAVRPVTVTTTVKEIVNTAEEQYILVDIEGSGERRLNFGTSGKYGEDRTLLVDGQTGHEASWDKVKAGDKVMVNYGPMTTFSIPPQSWLNYMLVNVEENPPVGLYQIEKMEFPATKVNKILTDGGGLWITVNIGEAWPDDDGLPNKLAFGDYFLAWYDVVAESYPAQTTATKVREFVTSEEQADKLANQAFSAKYGNEYKTVKLVCGKLNMGQDNGVHYQHGIVMLPLRAVAEELGWTVEWEAAAESAVISNGEQQAKVIVGKQEIMVNGNEDNYGARVNWHDYGICVPAPLFEALGAKVTVSGDTITITK